MVPKIKTERLIKGFINENEKVFVNLKYIPNRALSKKPYFLYQKRKF